MPNTNIVTDQEQVLLESQTARTSQLEQIEDRAEELLSKAKALHFNVWQGEGAATTEQVASFYEVSIKTVNSALRIHRTEFDLDGLKVLRGKGLSDAILKLKIASKVSQLTIWNPRATLRLGYLLRDSEIAKAVRTTSLDFIEQAAKPQTPVALPPARDAFAYAQLVSGINWLANDPIIRSLISQRMAEELAPGIAVIDAPEQPLNVTSIASNLGYSIQQIGNGADLGKYIRTRHQPLGTSQHGKYQVNVYLPSDVSNSINQYFDRSTQSNLIKAKKG